MYSKDSIKNGCAFQRTINQRSKLPEKVSGYGVRGQSAAPPIGTSGQPNYEKIPIITDCYSINIKSEFPHCRFITIHKTSY